MEEKKLRLNKVRVKECNMCTKTNPVGTKKCAHCGTRFKSHNKPSLLTKLRRLITGID